jgi:hypothetical protein
MVFHYFGTKRELYFYLVDLCGNTIISEVRKKFDPSITDFFERIKLASVIEIEAIRQYPALLTFLTCVYYENDEEVKGDLLAIFAQGDGFRSKIAFDGTDTTKFKDDIDINLIMKMLYWIADGFMNSLKNKTADNFEIFYKDFNDCLDLLKNNFYKQEYL